MKYGYNEAMSLPETQPEFSHNQRADRLDLLAALLCRSHVEQLFEEGRRLGRLATVNNYDRTLEIDVFPDPFILYNDFQIPVHTVEAAKFYAAEDESAMTYRIQHFTTVNVIGGVKRQLRREFWLFYDMFDETTYEINPEFSWNETTIEMCGESDEEVATLINEGGQLTDMQQSIVQWHQHDIGRIKGYQVQEINRLVTRAYSGLRSS